MANLSSSRPSPNKTNILQDRNSTVDWELRATGPVNKSLTWLERLSLALERPLVWLTREHRYNPLYHTGTIATFLLLLVAITGIYLTLFYSFGFDVSYEAVAILENNLVGRIMRAVHRYASGLSVIFTLLHGWRMFFMDRFRGPRWLAWASGVVMTLFLWIAGVTGYWLIWDTRALVLNQSLYDLLGRTDLGVRLLVDFVVGSQAANGWLFVWLIITIHLGVSVLIGVGYWLHLRRLNRAKMLPPVFWMAIVLVLTVVVALALPVGNLPAMLDGARAAELPIDPLFLFMLPVLRDTGLPAWLVWGAALLLLIAVTAVPWLLVRKPLTPIKIKLDACTGCTLCAIDCPYNALTMAPRSDGKHHKFEAVVDPALCVACGVCVGSCDFDALSLNTTDPAALKKDIVRLAHSDGDSAPTVVFTCERHVKHGASSYLNRDDYRLVPLTCVGMATPAMLTDALDAGARDVLVVGCPAEDCSNREGNLWLAQRLARERKPWLRRNRADDPIATHWLAPDTFKQAFSEAPNAVGEASSATAYSNMPLTWVNLIPAVVLVAVLFGVQALSTNVPYRVQANPTGLVEIAMTHHSTYPLSGFGAQGEPEFGADYPVRLLLEVDGATVLDKTYQPRAGRGRLPVAHAFEQVPVELGDHPVRLTLFDGPEQMPHVLVDETHTFVADDTLQVRIEDEPVFGDPNRGRRLLLEQNLGTNLGCLLCHSVDEGPVGIGPSLVGVGSRAATTVPGMSASAYLRESIVDHDAHVLPGYEAGLANENYDERLSEQDIKDLVAFMLTLEDN